MTNTRTVASRVAIQAKWPRSTCQPKSQNDACAFGDAAPLFGEDDESVFVATLIGLIDRKEEGALLGKAESILRELGDVTSVPATRVEPGRAALFGRFITIVCRSAHVPD